MRLCSIEGCSRRYKARGYCAFHYQRLRIKGDPNDGGTERGFWTHVRKGSGDKCWIWTGASSGGYGNTGHGGKTRKAHNVAYEELVGPIPNGLVLDHLCRVPNCVNPAHLEPVTRRENTLRGVGPSAVHAAKNQCINGHPFDDENTYFGPRGNRQCRACNRAAVGRYKAREQVQT